MRRAVVGGGALAVVAAVVLALVPLHHEGVSGNAVRPTYKGFGWVSYSLPPENATVSELRAAGVQVPAYVDSSRHAVAELRRLVGGLATVGVVLIAGGLLVRRRTPS
jgi:hypothetical protein